MAGTRSDRAQWGGSAIATAALIEQRCLHHPDREAAARCPSCKRNFCRECVTEHDGKVTCAECLAKLLATAEGAVNTGTGTALLVLWASLGVVLAWLVFYAVGTYLSGLPSELHGL